MTTAAPNDYLSRIARAIREEAAPGKTGQDALYRIYAVLALAKGEGVTDEDVHDAWCAATLAREPDDSAILPFRELSATRQARDRPFTEAIRAVARRAATIAKALRDADDGDGGAS